MKKVLFVTLTYAVSMPLLAQETNLPAPPRAERRFVERMGDDREQRLRRPDRNPEAEPDFQEKRLELMDRALEGMGLTEEQRSQIVLLQQGHREQMKANMQRLGAARANLSRLQDEGADEAAIDAAIDELSEAQAEQLKILVRNRMEMERILGKEKHAQFMENARMQFRRHGKHGGPELPPRPGLPPLPEEGPVLPVENPASPPPPGM